MWSYTYINNGMRHTSNEAFNTRRSTFDDKYNKAGAELLVWISIELEVFSDLLATKNAVGCGGM
jgi:hypothetical protein